MLHGTKDKTRLNPAEPIPPDLPLSRPPWLSGPAADEWDRVSPFLTAMGVLTIADIIALAAYCESYARWRRLTKLATDSPPVLQGREGNMVKNPVYGQVRDADAALRSWLREFGFTPSARTGIRVEHVITHASERILNRPG